MSTTPHFGLTISPAKSAAKISSTQTVTVYDQGTKPMTVTMSASEIVRNTSGKCVVSPHDANWATIGPVHFTLQPGKHQVTTLHILAGASPGKHDLTAWATTPVGIAHNGSLTVQTNAALGSQFLVTVPGNVSLTAPKPCVSIAAPASPGGPPLTLLIGGSAGLLLILAMVVWALALRRRARRPQAVTSHTGGGPMTEAFRARKQQPWYHEPLPRCDAETRHTGDQCVNSARYTNGRVHLCKTHRDMAVSVGMKGLKPIRQKSIDLRATTTGQVVPLRSAG